ncbi:hypothetical protein HDU98_007961 [Podochytrium sp. JEL0797]|nr:hypothetical protein HDU98_007961 [Podochytrium sp. JEL0797]
MLLPVSTNDANGVSPPLLAGLIGGGIAIVLAALAVACFCFKREARKKTNKEMSIQFLETSATAQKPRSTPRPVAAPSAVSVSETDQFLMANPVRKNTHNSIMYNYEHPASVYQTQQQQMVQQAHPLQQQQFASLPHQHAASPPMPVASSEWRVVYPHVSSHEDELALHPGDLIVLTHQYPDGWGFGFNRYTNQQGAFPLTCLAKEQPTPPPPPPTPTALPRLPSTTASSISSSPRLNPKMSFKSVSSDSNTAGQYQPAFQLGRVYDVRDNFHPELSDELLLRIGDRVELLKFFADGWAHGKVVPRGNGVGAVGTFPLECIGKPRVDNKKYAARVSSFHESFERTVEGGYIAPVLLKERRGSEKSGRSGSSVVVLQNQYGGFTENAGNLVKPSSIGGGGGGGTGMTRSPLGKKRNSSIQAGSLTRSLGREERDSLLMQSSGSRCRVVKNFKPQLVDEIELYVGDVVVVGKRFDDDWAFGVNVTSGMEGIFPIASVSLVASTFLATAPVVLSQGLIILPTALQTQLNSILAATTQPPNPVATVAPVQQPQQPQDTSPVTSAPAGPDPGVVVPDPTVAVATSNTSTTTGASTTVATTTTTTAKPTSGSTSTPFFPGAETSTTASTSGSATSANAGNGKTVTGISLPTILYALVGLCVLAALILAVFCVKRRSAAARKKLNHTSFNVFHQQVTPATLSRTSLDMLGEKVASDEKSRVTPTRQSPPPLAAAYHAKSEYYPEVTQPITVIPVHDSQATPRSSIRTKFSANGGGSGGTSPTKRHSDIPASPRVQETYHEMQATTALSVVSMSANSRAVATASLYSEASPQEVDVDSEEDEEHQMQVSQTRRYRESAVASPIPSALVPTAFYHPPEGTSSTNSRRGRSDSASTPSTHHLAQAKQYNQVFAILLRLLNDLGTEVTNKTGLAHMYDSVSGNHRHQQAHKNQTLFSKISRHEVEGKLGLIRAKLQGLCMDMFDASAIPGVMAQIEGQYRQKLAFLNDGDLADGREFWEEGRFGVADVYAYVILSWSKQLGIELEDYPNVKSYLDGIILFSVLEDV